MQFAYARFVNQFNRVLEIFIAFGRKTANKIGAESCFGTDLTYLSAKTDNALPRVAAAHFFQNIIVAGLNGKVKVRVNIGIFSNQGNKFAVNGGGIERAEL